MFIRNYKNTIVRYMFINGTINREINIIKKTEINDDTRGLLTTLLMNHIT